MNQIVDWSKPLIIHDGKKVCEAEETSTQNVTRIMVEGSSFWSYVFTSSGCAWNDEKPQTEGHNIFYVKNVEEDKKTEEELIQELFAMNKRALEISEELKTHGEWVIVAEDDVEIEYFRLIGAYKIVKTSIVNEL